LYLLVYKQYKVGRQMLTLTLSVKH